MRYRHFMVGIGLITAIGASGCSARKVDLSNVARPDRPTEMAAYDVFVGSWTWEADMANAAESDKHWTGTAEWGWGLDKRVLEGRMSVKSKNAEFEASGVWSWHPARKKYVWWMFNNWGYPHSGTAKVDKSGTSWTMSFRGVGLDGTTSYGRHTMDVIDRNTLRWTSTEWADPLHLIKKMEMTGTYKRK